MHSNCYREDSLNYVSTCKQMLIMLCYKHSAIHHQLPKVQGQIHNNHSYCNTVNFMQQFWLDP